jgi:hypothetical protein
LPPRRKPGANVCLLRSSIMIRAAPWEVLGTSAAAGRWARGRSSGCVRTPKPPQRKLQRWRLAHHSTLARVETMGGRDQSERLVAINCNSWSRSLGARSEERFHEVLHATLLILTTPSLPAVTVLGPVLFRICSSPFLYPHRI